MFNMFPVALYLLATVTVKGDNTGVFICGLSHQDKGLSGACPPGVYSAITLLTAAITFPGSCLP